MGIIKSAFTCVQENLISPSVSVIVPVKNETRSFSSDKPSALNYDLKYDAGKIAIFAYNSRVGGSSDSEYSINIKSRVPCFEDKSWYAVEHD